MYVSTDHLLPEVRFLDGLLLRSENDVEKKVSISKSKTTPRWTECIRF